MKETKFRAIHKLTKKKWTNEELVFHNGAWYEDWRAFEDGTPLNMTQCAVVEYTGLKDKNGVEIYEGDIVHLTSDEGVNYNALIVFKDGGFCAIDGTESDYGFRRYDLSRFDLYLEVIGDIYENPELLDIEEREAE